MTDDYRDRMYEVPSPQGGEPPRGSPASILDALDMAGVGDIEITFERPSSHPRPVTFE